jgi:hypothetical protein
MRIFVTAAASAALLFAAGSTAAQTAPPLQVTYPTDPMMTCEQLAAEVGRMDQIMGLNAQGIASAQSGAQAANLGQTVAIEGLARSGVLGRMPGIGMFANAASGMAKQSAAAKQKQHEDEMQTAQTRKTVMIGLYQGRACGMPQPQAAPAPTPASSGL